MLSSGRWRRMGNWIDYQKTNQRPSVDGVYETKTMLGNFRTETWSNERREFDKTSLSGVWKYRLKEEV